MLFPVTRVGVTRGGLQSRRGKGTNRRSLSRHVFRINSEGFVVFDQLPRQIRRSSRDGVGAVIVLDAEKRTTEKGQIIGFAGMRGSMRIRHQSAMGYQHIIEVG